MLASTTIGLNHLQKANFTHRYIYVDVYVYVYTSHDDAHNFLSRVTLKTANAQSAHHSTIDDIIIATTAAATLPLPRH